MNKQFHELIHQAKQKGRTSQNLTNLRNYLNESYQQFEFLNIKNSFDRLIHNLQYLAKQENANPKCFVNILNSPDKFSSSLLSLCQNILQLLQQKSRIKILHQHHNSQVIFLALFLKFCNADKYVSVLTTKLNFKNWWKYLIDPKSIDPQSDLKSLLKQCQITIHFIQQFDNQQVVHSNQILIFDLMNAEVVEYRPLLLKLKQTLTVPQKLIIYHSHFDQVDINNVLKQTNIQFYATEATQTYPIEINYVPKDIQIKQTLIQFLKEDSNHPQKQDVIIFYKNQHLSNSNAKKYSHKLIQVLTQNHLQSHVQIITDKTQCIQPGKNHIFLAQNHYQILKWNFTYQNVLFVIDYGWNVNYNMDHDKNCFIQSLNRTCLLQKTKRLAFVGISKVGTYIYAQQKFDPTIQYLDRSKQVMSYILKMINLGLSQFLQKQNTRVKMCIQILLKNKIIKQNQDLSFSIVNDQIFKLNKLGIDPIQAIIINSFIEKQTQKQTKPLSNLILMAICIINTRGNLRQIKDNIGAHTVIKPTGIWRKSGYLDSCLQILTKAQIIQSGKNIRKSLSKSKSKVQQFIDGFGPLFDEVVAKKLEFEDMKMDDLLRQYFVSDRIFASIRNYLDELRQIFEIEQTNVKFDQNLLNQIIEGLSHFVPNCVAVFSGSRRYGYRYKNQTLTKKSIFSNRQCLMAQLNQSPQFVIILRCLQNEGKKQILMSNTVHLDSFMSIFGQLPHKKSDSLAEHELQFHGISSSIFKGLFRNNGIQMKNFQEQSKCFIEPNQQMATITVYCLKDQSQKLKTAFQQLIIKIKDKYVNYNKIVNYMGNTNVSMSNGGQVKQIIKDNYINRCYLNNLDLQVTQEDLQDLVEGFFVLKSIQIIPAQFGKFSKSAIIQFNSQKDYYRFFSYYNEVKYFDRILDVKPIVMNKNTVVQAQNFIDFKWYVWKSHKKAIIVFKNIKSAEEAFKYFKQNPLIDGNNAQFSIDQKKIILDNLHQTVDQIFLQKAFLIYGQIQLVQILKTPSKQPVNQQSLIDYLIKDTLQIPKHQDTTDRFTIYQIQKHKNGLRKCRVLVKKIDQLNALVGKLNNVKGKIGEGRLYTQSMFTKPILIAYPTAVQLYETLLNQTISKDPQKPNIRFSLKDLGHHRIYLILSSPLKGTLDFISNEFEKKFKPKQVKLSTLQKTIILSQVGISNLIDLQQKFNCKLVVNTIKKSLQVICKISQFNKISEQINFRVQDKFFYRISLNSKSYKNLSKDKAKLEEIKSKYFLTLLQIEQYSKTLIFQGNASQVQNALNYMMHLIQSFSKSEQQLINTEVCLICYEEPTRPYRLQNCGHKFCFGCLDQCINSILGDITMFPIKCPHCMVELTIDDLESLIETGSWNKLINMGVTQFVNKNAQFMSFCYTPGCKQINMLKLTGFKCDVCAVSYCCECKQRWHEGMTCQQAKQNVDMLFKKYMEQNDVRICPNSNCKMPIVRTDGCFRVTCSRCNKSMCFKCPADKMIAYDDYNECYKHLNDAHGGYW